MAQQELYELPEGWEWKKFTKVTTTKGFSVGKIPKSKYLNKGSTPIIDQSKCAIAGYCNTKEAFKGKLPAIVYGDHTNNVKTVGFPFICGSDGTKVFIPSKDISAQFLFRSIERFKPKTQGYRRHVPILKKIQIPVPPWSEQERIVKRLDALFSRIDQAIAQVQNTQTQIKALWASTLDNAFNPTQDRNNLPEGWEWRAWEDILEIFNGRSHKEVKCEDGKFLIMGSGGKMGKASAFITPKYSTIIGRKGTINNPIFVEEPFWNIDTAFGVSSNNSYNRKLLHYFCLSFNFETLNKSTTLPSLTKRDLYRIQIPVPPLPEQKAIVARLDAISERTQALKAAAEKQLKQLEALKASLLDAAFRGKV